MIDFSFWYTTIILILMTVVLVKEIFEPDLVVFSALILLTVGKVINVNEALVGFSNSGMLSVGFLFIIAESFKTNRYLKSTGFLYVRE
ncbi:MAG: hypothetical protein JSW07_18675 [bacterium]|nr:MAG: hypothetical protein JSW07_18675 [bacterium]